MLIISQNSNTEQKESLSIGKYRIFINRHINFSFKNSKTFQNNPDFKSKSFPAARCPSLLNDTIPVQAEFPGTG